MKRLVTTPLSNTIWWATVYEKSGTMNTDTRIDVTDNAIDAVFEHMINLERFRNEGFGGYSIPKRNSDEKVNMAVYKTDKYICVERSEYEELKEFKKKYEEKCK